jgi:hypothetical protein
MLLNNVIVGARGVVVATSIVGLIPKEVIGFFNGVNSTSVRNEYQESSWGKGQPVHKADAHCHL